MSLSVAIILGVVLGLAAFYVFCLLYKQLTTRSFAKTYVGMPLAEMLLKKGHVKIAMQVRNLFR